MNIACLHRAGILCAACACNVACLSLMSVTLAGWDMDLFGQRVYFASYPALLLRALVC